MAELKLESKTHKHLAAIGVKLAKIFAVLMTMLGLALLVALFYLIPHWSEIDKIFDKNLNQSQVESYHQVPIRSKTKVLREDLHILRFLGGVDWRELPVFDDGPWAVFKEDYTFTKIPLNKCSLPHCFQLKLHLSQIPSMVWNTLIAVEDKRFLDHPGVDLKSLARALYYDLKEMRMAQGGSTLTQQLVKNLFLDQEKRISRKFLEAMDSIYIESKYSKRDIINVYLNETFWGSLQGTRLHGVGAASWFYFQKQISELTDYEVVILVSMLKGPGHFTPIKNIMRLRDRANSIFKIVKNENQIPSSAQPWEMSDWNQWEKNLKDRNKSRLDSFLGEIKEEDYLSGNDIFAQMIFERSAFSVLQDVYSRFPEATDLSIKAIFVPLNCETSEKCKTIKFYSKKERQLESAISVERHQVGSILKPLIYGIILNSGIDVAQQVSSVPPVLKLKSGDWQPNESHKIEESEVDLKSALQKSLNGPTIRLVEQAGWQNVEDGLKAYFPNIKTPLNEFPSQILGAVELSLAEVAGAYKKFLLKECSPQASGEGEVLKILSDPTQTTLKNVIDPFVSDTKFFGKTGTTNDGRESWFIGFDGEYLGVIYFGNESTGKKKWARLSGATAAYKVYQSYWKHRGFETPLSDACPTLKEISESGMWEWPW